MRAFLAAIVALGSAGVAAELLFMGHIEEWRQLLPLGTIGVSLASLVAVVLRPARGTVRLFQAAMLLMIVAGGLGVWFHYAGNREFQLEMDASQRGLDLLLKILHAKAPPALAPGVMAQLGFIGLVYTYRHPSLTLEGV
jgi:hypothetical protein